LIGKERPSGNLLTYVTTSYKTDPYKTMRKGEGGGLGFECTRNRIIFPPPINFVCTHLDQILDKAKS